MARIAAPVAIDGETKRGLSRFLRARLLTPGIAHVDSNNAQRCRLLMSAINSLNVIARRCEGSSPEAVVQVIAHLAALEREFRMVANTK